MQALKAQYLSSESGQWNFGIFDRPFENADPTIGLGFPAELKAIRCKEWQAIQLGDENQFMLATVYNAKTMAIIQFKHWDIKKNHKIIYEKIVPSWQVTVARSLYGQKSVYRDDQMQIEIQNDYERLKTSLVIKIKNTGKFKNLPSVDLEVTATSKPEWCQNAVMPITKTNGVATNKILHHIQLARFQFGPKLHEINLKKSFFILDDHKGFYPWEMKYDWLTFAGSDNSGHPIAVNLTRNQARQPDIYHENCLWHDGGIVRLTPVEFHRPEGVRFGWHIGSPDGKIDINFKPLVAGDVMLNLGVFKSEYYGPFGLASGTIQSDKKKFKFENVPAMAEKVYLRL